MLIHSIPISGDYVHMNMPIFLSRIRAFIEPHGKSRRGKVRFLPEILNAGMASFNDPPIGFFRQSDIMLIPFNKINPMKLIKQNPPGNLSKLQIFFVGQFKDAFNVP